jgi:hypothetical protein
VLEVDSGGCHETFSRAPRLTQIFISGLELGKSLASGSVLPCFTCKSSGSGLKSELLSESKHHRWAQFSLLVKYSSRFCAPHFRSMQGEEGRKMRAALMLCIVVKKGFTESTRAFFLPPEAGKSISIKEIKKISSFLVVASSTSSSCVLKGKGKKMFFS